ncbi:sulfite oxidase-like oxidoreductase [Nakamurella deserti]|uniref:sulfite oxidase-like oxidoreductase n=1 Tax=Nakamurella deserti TaxID=2164074 RepID=UPI000DBE0F87|nr:sulfite oxidase-like oxidoreductase [Nakamurella deserti]
MSSFTRGFGGRARRERDPRLPPGQYDTGADWPVLTAEVTPHFTLDRWSFTLDGLVDRAKTWTWADIQALPSSDYHGDIHCVTTWSKFDTHFHGISLDVLLDQVTIQPEARFILATSTTGYTTNMGLDDIRGGKAWLAWEFGGKPLPREHGGPIRLLVPHLYFWKSAKWVDRITLLHADEPGFWERNGYHDHGDPWTEQRYQGD